MATAASTTIADVKITITDNSPEVLKAVEIAIARALWSVGATAEKYAKQEAPVDTGRLRNSITHQETNDKTIIGTNVEYARAQEFGTSRGIRPHHYMQKAAADHSEEYKKLVEDSLKNV